MVDLEELNSIFKTTESLNSMKDVNLVEYEGKIQVIMSLDKFKYFNDCEKILEDLTEVLSDIKDTQ